MNDARSAEAGRLGLDADDLDGHTLEELSDYLESGRTPRDPSIEGSAGCRLALDALERLHGLAGGLLEADAAAEPPADDAWIARVLGGIAMDARAGRSIPLSSDAGASLSITEGAVRGIVRSAENDVPGALVGRLVLRGDVTEPGEPIVVGVDVSVPFGRPIPLLAEEMRAAIARRLRLHTELNVEAIDVTVHDIRTLPAEEEL